MSLKFRAQLVVQRILAASALLFVSMMAHADSTITIFNIDGQAGTSAAGVNGPFSLTNSEVSSIGIFGQGPGSSLTFTTGAFLGGSLTGTAAAEGQIGSWDFAGSNFVVTGSWNGFTGNVFNGAFTGVISWIDNGCTGAAAHETCHYILSGPITGTWANGTRVTGETTQILFTFTGKALCTGCGNYNGGKIEDAGGSTAITTPEPNSLGFMGAGLLGLGLVVRRKIRE